MKKGDKVRCICFNGDDNYSSTRVTVGSVYTIDDVFPTIPDGKWLALREGNFTFKDDEGDLRLSDMSSVFDTWEVVND